jgi:hypothetical protein
MTGVLAWLQEAWASLTEGPKRKAERDASHAETLKRIRVGQEAWTAMMQEQRNRLGAGAEIEPPWLVTPDYDPRHYHLGDYNDFAEDIWRPYIRALTNEQRAAYFTTWPPPPGLWHPFIRRCLGSIDDPTWRE